MTQVSAIERLCGIQPYLRPMTFEVT